jgi:uncharacterized protein (DUF2384 family)
MADLHNSGNPAHKQILERGLYLFNGDEDAFRKWLDAPDPQLDDMTPHQVIDQGHPQVVVSLIEEALRGISD